MKTKFIEATNRMAGADSMHGNWGKFMLARFDREEWDRPVNVPLDASAVRLGLLYSVGWRTNHLLVLDLQTGEGAMFSPHGSAKADLDKHKVWVCPLFEPFLTWLYTQDLSDLDALPAYVELTDAPFAFSGYRREGGEDGSGHETPDGNA